MTKYRFDWKDVIHGSIEIEANCGNDANEKFSNGRLVCSFLNSETGNLRDPVENKNST